MRRRTMIVAGLLAALGAPARTEGKRRCYRKRDVRHKLERFLAGTQGLVVFESDYLDTVWGTPQFIDAIMRRFDG